MSGAPAKAECLLCQPDGCCYVDRCWNCCRCNKSIVRVPPPDAPEAYGVPPPDVPRGHDVVELRTSLEWCAQTIHQAHHRGPGKVPPTETWQECRRGFCQSVRHALGMPNPGDG